MSLESFNLRTDFHSTYRSLDSDKLNANPTKLENMEAEQSKIKIMALLKIFGLKPCPNQTKDLIQKISSTSNPHFSKPEKNKELTLFQTLFKPTEEIKPTEIVKKPQSHSNFFKTGFNKLLNREKGLKSEKSVLSNEEITPSPLLVIEDSAEIMIKKFIETYLESYIELSKTALNLVEIRKPLMTALNEELIKRGNDLNEAEQLAFFEEMEKQQPFISEFALTVYLSKAAKDFYQHLGDQAMRYPSAETIQTFLPSLVEILEENITIDFPSYSLTNTQLEEKIFIILFQIATNPSKPV